MPDLITHTVAAYIIRKRSISTPDLLLYIFGAMLPDLATRPFMILYPPSRYFFHTFHTPVAMMLIVYLISQFFEDSIKNHVMKLLGLGVLTHLFLDFFQAGVGARGYSWFFPFSYWDFNYGLFWPEDSISVLPIVITVFLVDFLYTYFKNRKSVYEMKKINSK